MVQAARFQGINQCLKHVFLTNHVRERFWPPFAGQNEIAHTVWDLQRFDTRSVSVTHRPAVASLKRDRESGPRQLFPGTRNHRYRCSLPGLAEFTIIRRGEADTDRAGLSPEMRVLFNHQ